MWKAHADPKADKTGFMCFSSGISGLRSTSYSSSMRHSWQVGNGSVGNSYPQIRKSWNPSGFCHINLQIINLQYWTHTKHHKLEFICWSACNCFIRLNNQITFISRTTSTHVRVCFSVRFVFNCDLWFIIFVKYHLLYVPLFDTVLETWSFSTSWGQSFQTFTNGHISTSSEHRRTLDYNPQS